MGKSVYKLPRMDNGGALPLDPAGDCAPKPPYPHKLTEYQKLGFLPLYHQSPTSPSAHVPPYPQAECHRNWVAPWPNRRPSSFDRLITDFRWASSIFGTAKSLSLSKGRRSSFVTSLLSFFFDFFFFDFLSLSSLDFFFFFFFCTSKETNISNKTTHIHSVGV